MSKWNTTKLMAAAGLGVVYLAFGLLFAVITAPIGIPGIGGAVNMFISGALFALVCLVIRRFGAAAIMGFIASVLAIPFSFLGPPGFFLKIIVGVVVGLVADMVFLFLAKTPRLASLVIGALTQLLFGLGIVGFGFLIGVPGIDKLAKLLLSPFGIAGALIGGAIGGFVGWLIYRRIEKFPVVRRIQA